MQNSEHVSTNPENLSKTVAIIGAGLIGCGWAIVFARAGWRVNLYDLHQHALVAAQDTIAVQLNFCLLYTSPSPRDLSTSRMPSSA